MASGRALSIVGRSSSSGSIANVACTHHRLPHPQQLLAPRPRFVPSTFSDRVVCCRALDGRVSVVDLARGGGEVETLAQQQAPSVPSGSALAGLDQMSSSSTATTAQPAQGESPSVSSQPASAVQPHDACVPPSSGPANGPRLHRSWEAWCDFFEAQDEAAAEQAALLGRLAGMVAGERFEEAATLQERLAGLEEGDGLAVLRSRVEAALAAEDYAEAAALRDAGWTRLAGWWCGIGEDDPHGHLLCVSAEYGRWTGKVYTTRDLAEHKGWTDEAARGSGGAAALAGALARSGVPLRGGEGASNAPQLDSLGTPLLELFVRRCTGQDGGDNGWESRAVALRPASSMLGGDGAEGDDTVAAGARGIAEDDGEDALVRFLAGLLSPPGASPGPEGGNPGTESVHGPHAPPVPDSSCAAAPGLRLEDWERDEVQATLEQLRGGSSTAGEEEARVEHPEQNAEGAAAASGLGAQPSRRWRTPAQAQEELRAELGPLLDELAGAMGVTAGSDWPPQQAPKAADGGGPGAGSARGTPPLAWLGSAFLSSALGGSGGGGDSAHAVERGAVFSGRLGAWVGEGGDGDGDGEEGLVELQRSPAEITMLGRDAFTISMPCEGVCSGAAAPQLGSAACAERAAAGERESQGDTGDAAASSCAGTGAEGGPTAWQRVVDEVSRVQQLRGGRPLPRSKVADAVARLTQRLQQPGGAAAGALVGAGMAAQPQPTAAERLAAANAGTIAAPWPSPGRVTYRRVATKHPRTDPFSGLYLGSFGPHGPELLQLSRGKWEDGEECVVGAKLTGDANVPAGAVSFRAKVGRRHRLDPRDVYPPELGVVARYRGEGRVAQPGFKNARWVEGELLQFSAAGSALTGNAPLGFVWSVPNERRFLILLNRIELD